MDLIKLRDRMKEGIHRYRGVAIVILAGILLMGLPDRKEKIPEIVLPASNEISFSARLEEILGCMEGAGKVRLLLSEETGPMTLYQCDEQRQGTEGEMRRDTVVVTDGSRREQGLIRQVASPRYRGAVVIAQGADRPAVKLAIVNAVSRAAGLSTDKISVLKMK